MTRAERDEFWRRFHIAIERFREAGTDCDIAVNSFENRQWDVKFSKRRGGDRMVSVSLAILEHAPSREQFLLAVTPTCTVDGDVTGRERFLIPVFFDPVSGTFSLQADHGPVEESRIPDFFAGTADALLSRL
jgi:hypothetical protein